MKKDDKRNQKASKPNFHRHYYQLMKILTEAGIKFLVLPDVASTTIDLDSPLPYTVRFRFKREKLTDVEIVRKSGDQGQKDE